MHSSFSVHVCRALHPPTLTLESLLAEAPAETKSRLNTAPTTHTHTHAHWIQNARRRLCDWWLKSTHMKAKGLAGATDMTKLTNAGIVGIMQLFGSCGFVPHRWLHRPYFAISIDRTGGVSLPNTLRVFGKCRRFSPRRFET